MSARVIRTASVIGLITTVGVAGVANAGKRPKPKPIPPVCNLITDPAGDATGGLVSSSNQPDWDILSADIATNATMVTTVIRVAKLSKTGSDPLGSQWRFDFTVGSVKLYTQATSTTSFGDKFIIGYTDSTSHAFASSGATGVFDLGTNEVRVTAPLAATATQAKITPGTVLSTLGASAGDYVNVAGGSPSDSVPADSATGDKNYVAGRASCVTVGK